jgi:hypothetical protein
MVTDTRLDVKLKVLPGLITLVFSQLSDTHLLENILAGGYRLVTRLNCGCRSGPAYERGAAPAFLLPAI